MVFHEITKDAVKEAIEHPRDIDENLRRAQEARRVLDRLVGYDLSGLIWKKVRYGLSAGRVQSPALRIVMERREIRAFKPEKFWTITADVSAKNGAGDKFTLTCSKNRARKKANRILEVGNKEDMESERCRRDGSQEVTASAVHHLHPPTIGQFPFWIRSVKNNGRGAKALRSRSHHLYEDEASI